MGEKKGSFVTNLIAGLISKIPATILTYPLTRSVTLLRVEGANPTLGAPARPFGGGFFAFVDVIRQTTASLGWRANYNGAALYLVGGALTKPLKFALNDWVKGVLPRYDPKREFASFAMVNFSSGAAAGLLALPFSCLVGWPVTRAQADLRPDGVRLGPFSHLRQMMRPATGRMMLSVVPLSLLGAPLFRGAYFGVNDTLRGINPYQRDRGALGLASKFAIAQTASLAAQAVTYPIGTAVDRLVCANYESHATLRDTARAAMEGRGVAGLFRGLKSQLSTSVGSGLMLMLYGELKGLAARR